MLVPEVLPGAHLDDVAADAATAYDSYRTRMFRDGAEEADEELAYAVDAAIRYLRMLHPRRVVDVASERRMVETVGIDAATPEQFIEELNNRAGEEQ